MESKTINLWSAMTKLADKHRKDPEEHFGIEEDAAEVVGACGKWGGFGTELSLTVADNGEWAVKIFSHEDSDFSVEFAVLPCGTCRVRRRLVRGDIADERLVTF